MPWAYVYASCCPRSDEEKKMQIAIRADHRVTDCVSLFLLDVSLKSFPPSFRPGCRGLSVMLVRVHTRKRYAKTWTSGIRVQILRLTTSLNLSQHLTSLKPANKLSAAPRFSSSSPAPSSAIFYIFRGGACTRASGMKITRGREVGGPVNEQETGSPRSRPNKRES